MAIYITSDWHLGHDREFIWKVRGYSSIEEMNQAVIDKHNSIVMSDDDVYVLGDCCLGAPENIELIKQFNGKLHLVRGNHDSNARWTMYKELPNVVEMQNAIYLDYRKHHFYMSHYPTLTGNLQKESLRQMTLNLFGHTHQTEKFFNDMPYMYCCCADAHNCYPVLLDDIIEQMKNKVEECKLFL